MNQFLGNLKIENEQRYLVNNKMESKNKISEEFDEYDEELIGNQQINISLLDNMDYNDMFNQGVNPHFYSFERC
jgi:hypothetical protein